jgi:hypothetical protein
MNEKGFDVFFTLVFLIAGLLSVAFVGTLIWGIVKLINHYT